MTDEEMLKDQAVHKKAFFKEFRTWAQDVLKRLPAALAYMFPEDFVSPWKGGASAAVVDELDEASRQADAERRAEETTTQEQDEADVSA